MKLQGRNLRNGDLGDDVRLLQEELELLGFHLVAKAKDTEITPKIFGPHTLVAVREVQKAAGLKVTGVVDEATAKAINERVGERPGGDGDEDDDALSLRDRVFAIARFKDRSLAELRRENPKLFKRLELRVIAERRESVLSSFEKSSQELRQQIGKVDFSLGNQPERDLKEVILAGLASQKAEPKVAEEAIARILELGRSGQLTDPAAVDLPLKDHPMFQRDLQAAEVFEVADLIRLPDPKIEKLLTRTESLANLRDETFAQLVQEQALADTEARHLGLATSLYWVADERVEVADVLIRDGKVSRPQDLLSLDFAAWEDVLTRAGSTPPDGLDREAYARQLHGKVAELFPSATLLYGDSPARRPDLVARVIEANPEAELLTLDLGADSDDLAKLTFPGFSDDERKLALDDFKSYQRTYALTGNVDDAKVLLTAGYDSALAVASLPFDTFQRQSGLSLGKARDYYAAAQEKTTAVTLSTGTILDLWRGGFLDLGVVNFGPGIKDYLQKIPGFAELFGSQDYCHCEHCQSILSPAAYFVDLMSFVEDYILDGIFTGSLADHVLNLKVRRPDLWTLPLACENINTLIPYLDIILEILESYLAQRRGFTGNLADRGAVEDYVYCTELATAEDSFRQPFFLPLEQLDAYLSALDCSRSTVARALRVSHPALAAAALQTSAREVELVTQKNEAFTFLREVYGLPLLVGADGKIDPFDAQDLLQPTGLSRAELGETIATRFVTTAGAETIEIRPEKRNADSVQNDIERIRGLTAGTLDRLHRFTRLRRRLPWSIAELDLVLHHLAQAGLATALDSALLPPLVSVLALRERWSLPLDQICALWSEIPRIPQGASLFDRLFNLPPFSILDGPLPKDGVLFIHPAFRSSGTPLRADSTLGRLLAGLGMNEDQLAQLIRQLAGHLGNVNPDDSNETRRGFLLTTANLTLLYRHARLAQQLALSIPELFQLLGQAGLSHVAGLADLEKLLDLHDAWKNSGFKLDDVGFITGRLVRDLGAYPDQQRLADEVVLDLRSKKSLQFADTVFAFLQGVTEEQSREIIIDNPGAIQRTDDGSAFRVAPGFNPAVPLILPDGFTVPEASVREILLQYHASQVLPVQLGRRLGLPAEKTAALLALTGVDLAGSGLAQALHGTGQLTPLTDLLGKLLPLTVLFRDTVFDPATLEWVRTHGSIFDITSFDALSVGAVRKVVLYTSLTSASDANPAAVQQVLTAFTATERFALADSQTLATAIHSDAALVATLVPNVTLPGTALEGLAMLARCARLAQDLGVDGETLKLIPAGSYEELQRASRTVLSALRTRYAGETEFRTRLEPFEDRLRSRKRDALVDFLIRSIHPEFDSPSELYHHFLIDIQLEGCARTSRVVAAISSVQLYVHRCLMNLEQDRRSPDDPSHVRVPPESIPAEEWAWRKNYRVWEANRKVFLYPENYLEPELRDDKTPLFRELEDRLLQQQINEQNVLDAYAAYLSGFEEVARLQIAGSYHDIGSEKDLLHLFGVTPGDPPTYYYRAIENAFHGETGSTRGVVYSPWRKIEVQIPVRKVAPIVYLGRLFVFWMEIVTTPKNEVTGGESRFTGYKHRLILKYTILRLDGQWTPPQAIALTHPSYFSSGDGIVEDPLREPAEEQEKEGLAKEWKLKQPRYDTRLHSEPIDGYTLQGFQWDQVYPTVSPGGQLVLTLRNFLLQTPIDLYYKVIVPAPAQSRGTRSTQSRGKRAVGGEVLCSRFEEEPVPTRRLYWGVRTLSTRYDYAHRSKVATDLRIAAVIGTEGRQYLSDSLNAGLYQEAIAEIGTGDDIAIINGSETDAILDAAGDLLLLQGSVRPGPNYLLKRLGTTLSENLSRQVFTAGVEGLLDLEYQESLGEAPLPITLLARIKEKVKAGQLDFTGSYGTYYKEIFFHAPMLIANHLNSQQRFAAAQRWYHYLFDPTAPEPRADATGTPLPDLDSDTVDRLRRDRVWRYREFRGLDVPKLRHVLTDPAAIEVYKKDPFNPHAIARLRISAYQKNVVMKYIDNLLDWGDSLFTQFTMESVNEATLLYVLAADILGPRPAELGSCGEGRISPKSYEKIKPALGKGSDFLLEMESQLWLDTGAASSRGKNRITADYVLDRGQVGFFSPTAVLSTASAHTGLQRLASAHLEAAAPATDTFAGSTAAGVISQPYAWKETRTGTWTVDRGQTLAQPQNDSPLLHNLLWIHGFAWGFLRQVGPVFCVPGNKELRQYWDRVEDRLYKIRHCLDITGARRQLALFAPEIDPRLLVRARAAGLSIDDVLNATSGDLPPYRFSYLIERARQHATTVQSFGAALLSALEKRDVEALSRLRTVHEQNLLRLTTRMKEWDIDVAQDAITTLERQQAAIEYRKNHYQGLIDGGLSRWEFTQQVARHTASGLNALAATQQVVAGVGFLIPEVGSPFAMKYGGVALGNSAEAFGHVTRNLSALAEAISASAGLEAGFQRREEDWKHQVQLADHELKQLEKQLTAARLRKEIAVRSLKLHQEAVKQLDEVFDFYNERFTNLGLYTWLSTTLQRLYREAFNGAYAMARLAEQAFRFERGDDASPLLQLDAWEASRAGLLAGERLLLDLQNLERRFLETNYRSLEVDQSFSLAQIDPAALVCLRETGTCTFAIPEVFFDLVYPGHYRRRIRSVRLTIPCVTGPYTNVGATLSLTGSRMRMEPQLDAILTEIPRRRSVSIATSKAQNDPGVFEFSFRDERYMPFEGAGAISDWSLSLPKSFPPFDYTTISDVILHISYTAEENGKFRQDVEQLNSGLTGTILNVLSSRPLRRVFSLRQDFSGAFNLLLHSAVDTPVPIKITDSHLPLFLKGRTVQVTRALLALKTPLAQTLGNVRFTFDGGAEQAGFSPENLLGGLQARDLGSAFSDGLLGDHILVAKDAGDLGPTPRVPGDPSAFELDKLLDVLLYVEFRL